MRFQKFLSFSLFSTLLLLGGCSSWFFPDFDEGSDIVVDDGGKVEVRKVEDKGILVADKSNALYEGEEEQSSPDATESGDNEEVVAAQVTPVKSEAIDNVKVSDNNFEPQIENNQPTMRYLAGIIYFNNGSAEVDAKSRAVLKEIAKTAKNKNAYVEVYGFASSRTRNTDPVSHKLANFEISGKRADNASSVLRSLGVKNDNISIQALSDSAPLYKEIMPEGERLNRRVEIYLTY